MNPLTFLATRCTVGGKERAYFDDSMRKDTENPNPLLAELLAMNKAHMREKVAAWLDVSEPLEAILLPETVPESRQSDDMQIIGLLEFLRKNEANAYFEFTTYED